MASRAQLQQRLARLEKQVEAKERAARYAQPVQLPTPSVDSMRAILKILIACGALCDPRPDTLGITLLAMQGKTYDEMEEHYRQLAQENTYDPTEQAQPVG